MNVRITGGSLRGRTLRAPRVAGLRPTADVVRAAIFSILGPEIVEGARILDLYAGTGAMGIEALSRRAAWADFVEANGRLTRGLRDNLRRLSVEERSRVYGARVEATLAHLPGGYTMVFCDPPYDMEDWDSLMKKLGQGSLVNKGGILVLEHRHTVALAEAYGLLTSFSTRRYGDTSITFYQKPE